MATKLNGKKWGGHLGSGRKRESHPGPFDSLDFFWPLLPLRFLPLSDSHPTLTFPRTLFQRLTSSDALELAFRPRVVPKHPIRSFLDTRLGRTFQFSFRRNTY